MPFPRYILYPSTPVNTPGAEVMYNPCAEGVPFVPFWVEGSNTNTLLFIP